MKRKFTLLLAAFALLTMITPPPMGDGTDESRSSLFDLLVRTGL